MGQDASHLRDLERNIGYTFINRELLKEAITHDSCRVNDPNLKNYQRLEFLGDSLLQMIITDYLFRTYPSEPEGQLSVKRANLVCRQKQLEIARKLELSKFIQMATGLQRQQFSRYDKFVEALIGAVYVDAGGDGEGYNKVKMVVYKLYEIEIPAAGGCILV